MLINVSEKSSETSADKDFLYGGQAVIEGVMMRGKTHMAVAVRKNDNEIVLHKEELNTFLKRYKFLDKPLVRGSVVLVDALRMGVRALFISAKESLGEEEAQKELGPGAIAVTFFFSFLIGIALFIVFPTWVTSLIKTQHITDMFANKDIVNVIVLNFVEGFIRVIIFLAYVLLISQMAEIKRIFQYHGAEHKVIYNYESGKPLTVENAKNFSCRHPRCGTSFIIMVLIMSIILHALWGWPDLWVRIVSRLVMLPVIAGLAYEMTRLAGKKNPFFSVLVRPGVWLQVLTTRNPSDDQIEVAIKAFKEILPESCTGNIPSPSAS
ncbi:MAG: DUF1385 domain-containing protein [Candidatus Eremiobacterota bacterium]